MPENSKVKLSDPEKQIITVLNSAPQRRLRWGDLHKETKLSTRTLSLRLKDLQKKRLVKRIVDVDTNKYPPPVYYQLSKGVFKLPYWHTITFEEGAFFRITGELTMKREAYIRKQKIIRQDKKSSEGFAYLELDPQFIAEKPESEIIQIIDKWLTPIVLYAIIQELKTEYEWTETIYGISQKLMELIKQKNLSKFEEALRDKYSKTLVQRARISTRPQEEIPLIDSLDEILEDIKSDEIIDWYEEHGWPSRKKVPPHVDMLTKRFVKRRKGKGKVFIHE